MNVMTRLTPAETFFMIEGPNANLRELQKFTLLDLLVKQVLKTRTVTLQPNEKDPEKAYLYVAPGDAFASYAGRPHEDIYLSVFRKVNKDENSILLRNLVRVGLETSKDRNTYHWRILQSPELNDCFSQNFFQRLIRDYSLTAEGKKLLEAAHAERQLLEKTLPDLLTNDPEKVTALVRLIGGNVFLARTVELDLMKKLDALLAEEITKTDYSPDAGCSTWMGTDSIDSSFDSHSHHDGHSGCSGNSGCSGDGSHSGDSGCSSGDSGCSSGCSGCGGD